MAESIIQRNNIQKMRIEHGSSTFNATGTTEASVYVAFNNQFETVPTVVLTLTASYNRRLHVAAVSTYGFTATGTQLTGTGTAAIPFYWVAVGE